VSEAEKVPASVVEEVRAEALTSVAEKVPESLVLVA
jgi:hypothetical protein